MTAPIVRNQIGAVAFSAYAAITSGSYSTGNRITVSGLATPNLLLADFRLTVVTFGAAPTAGAVQLIVVPRIAAGAAGPTPSAMLLPNLVYNFGPSIGPTNTGATFDMAVEKVPLPADSDVYIFNNATGQQINSGAILSYLAWSPGA